MASAAVHEAHRDVPALALPVDHQTASSPFPSPGSPFLPPPRLNAHEFASKPPSVDHIMRNITTKRISASDPTAAPSPMNGEATPTLTVHPTSGGLSPATPTPNSFQIPPTPIPQVTIPDPPEVVTPDGIPSRQSLTSSRPAPPSPAVSRRASSRLSRRSSHTRSRPQSRVTSLSQPPETAHQAESSSSTVQPPKRVTLLMKIRDFAFPPTDERHVGKGSDVPKPNRPRRRGSTYSSSSSQADDDEDTPDVEEDLRQSSWSSFRWNTLSSQFWGGGKSQEPGGAGPSMTDFDRNFEASSPAEEESEPEYGDDDEDDYGVPGEDEPLVPGTYRALYHFEPEGTAEMALEEEQIVHVVGRGGGVGWAIVEKEGGGHALVPESYLELVQVDDPSA